MPSCTFWRPLSSLISGLTPNISISRSGHQMAILGVCWSRDCVQLRIPCCSGPNIEPAGRWSLLQSFYRIEFGQVREESNRTQQSPDPRHPPTPGNCSTLTLENKQQFSFQLAWQMHSPKQLGVQLCWIFMYCLTSLTEEIVYDGLHIS